MSDLEDPDMSPGRCRDPNARQLILEAVRSHQTGAQRAAIVSIWIAVVYDLFGKLRELAQAGDANAQKTVEEIDRAVNDHNVTSAQKIEAGILKEARDKFGLLTANEHHDLERLYEDRHRSAHPSLNRPEEIYVPTPELVRLHLRNAVAHLLSQPPVQGRAALEHLQKEVDSDLFPKATADAAEYLRAGIYRRMKPVLVRDFCSAAIASCLNDPQITPVQFARRVRGINALRSINSDPVNDSLRDKLTPAARRVPDTSFHRVLRFLASINDACSRLEPDVQMRAQTYIANAKALELVQFIRYALVIPQFCEAARARVGDLTHAGLKHIFAEESREELVNFDVPPPELLDRVVELYVASSSWATSNALAKTLIVPYSALLNAEQVSQLLCAFPTNQELYESSMRIEVLRALHETGHAEGKQLDVALEKCELDRTDLDPG